VVYRQQGRGLPGLGQYRWAALMAGWGGGGGGRATCLHISPVYMRMVVLAMSAAMMTDGWVEVGIDSLEADRRLDSCWEGYRVDKYD